MSGMLHRGKRSHDQVDTRPPTVYSGVKATLAKKKAYTNYSKFYGSIDVRDGPNVLAIDNPTGCRIGRYSLGRIPDEHIDITRYKADVEKMVQEALEGTFFNESRIKEVFADAIEQTLGDGVEVHARTIQKIGLLGSMSTYRVSQDDSHYGGAQPQMITITQASRILRPIPNDVLDRIPAVRVHGSDGRGRPVGRRASCGECGVACWIASCCCGLCM